MFTDVHTIIYGKARVHLGPLNEFLLVSYLKSTAASSAP